jgi:hypothetical protein
MQLASALTWQESVGEEITLATFDQQLWEAAKRTGLKPWPEQLTGGTSGPALISTTTAAPTRAVTATSSSPPRA